MLGHKVSKKVSYVQSIFLLIKHIKLFIYGLDKQLYVKISLILTFIFWNAS